MKARYIILLVVLVLVILVMGLFIVRNNMCQGNISPRYEPPKFNLDNYGVGCMGEVTGDKINLNAGGRRGILCMIKTNETSEYRLKVTNIESLSGAKNNIVDKWIVDQDWTGSVSPGKDNYATILMFDIPRDAPPTSLNLTINIQNERGLNELHYSIIDIAQISLLDRIKNILCWNFI